MIIQSMTGPRLPDRSSGREMGIKTLIYFNRESSQMIHYRQPASQLAETDRQGGGEEEESTINKLRRFVCLLSLARNINCYKNVQLLA